MYGYELIELSGQRQYEYELRFDKRVVLRKINVLGKMSNVHADFKRQWNFAHMLCVSTPRLNLRGWFPLFFRWIFFSSKAVKFPKLSCNWPKAMQKSWPLGQVFVKANTRRLQHFTVWFYKKIINVSCESIRLNSWNSNRQTAWRICHVRWACLFYISFTILT